MCRRSPTPSRSRGKSPVGREGDSVTSHLLFFGYRRKALHCTLVGYMSTLVGYMSTLVETISALGRFPVILLLLCRAHTYRYFDCTLIVDLYAT